MNSVYFPREDSELLTHHVRQHAKGMVLDMGTGTGIQARAAAMRKQVKKVYAVDINPNAIKYCLKSSQSNKKIIYAVSDLFEVFKKKQFNSKSHKLLNKNSAICYSSESRAKLILAGHRGTRSASAHKSSINNEIRYKNIKFDTIVFNPPYLPQDHEKRDVSVIGGKKGYETIQRFLNEANDFLGEDGSILLLFSSLTNERMVDCCIADNLFEAKMLSTHRLFYETLYIYLLKRNSVSKALARLGVKRVSFLAQGKRKVVYTGMYDHKKVVIKAVRKGAKNSIGVEAKFMKILYEKGISPKLVVNMPQFLIAEYAEGEFIKDVIQKASKTRLIWLLTTVFKQCFALDSLGINKEEMHRPKKHVIIKNKKIVMIDFERCHYSQDPKNVTQFCQYIISLLPILKKKGFLLNRAEIIHHAQEYKKTFAKNEFNKIIRLIQNGHCVSKSKKIPTAAYSTAVS